MDISMEDFIELILFLMKETSHLHCTYILEAMIARNKSQVDIRSSKANRGKKPNQERHRY